MPCGRNVVRLSADLTSHVTPPSSSVRLCTAGRHHLPKTAPAVAKGSSPWISSGLVTPGHSNAGCRLIGQAHRVKRIVQGPETGSVQEDRSGPGQGTGGGTLVHTQIA